MSTGPSVDSYVTRRVSAQDKSKPSPNNRIACTLGTGQRWLICLDPARGDYAVCKKRYLILSLAMCRVNQTAIRPEIECKIAESLATLRVGWIRAPNAGKRGIGQVAIPAVRRAMCDANAALADPPRTSPPSSSSTDGSNFTGPI